ncbi:uncharacterized protein [Leptinotarsa decemlineata]|uniref:uncharacterized protein n=1 Tax=Leptinotarsa decemlineata TaxID=7539 RepID=UPI003D308369
MTCQNGLNLLKTVASRTWSSDSSMLMLIYRSLIRSKLDYGAIVYNSAKKSILKQLDTIHNNAIRIILGAFCTSPTESLYCEASEPSLANRRKLMTLTYAASIISNPDNPVYHNVIAQRSKNIFAKKIRADPPFYQRYNHYLSSLQLKQPSIFSTPNTPNTPPWIIPRANIEYGLLEFKKKNTNHRMFNVAFNHLLEQYEDFFPVYTDASKIEDGVGAAFTSSDFSCSFKLSKENTIITGELYAIWRTLKYMEKKNIPKFLIVTDSLNALETITQLYTNHLILLRIKQSLHLLHQKHICIRFMWVPSHMGIVGNERADKLAKEAVTNPLTDTVLLAVHTDLKSLYKQTIINSWQSQWNSSSAKLSQMTMFVNSIISMS